MNEKKFYLGIDIGTSSVKGILRNVYGESHSFKKLYERDCPEGWKEAIKSLIADINLLSVGKISAVVFSSQVGTYVVDEKYVIPWHSDVGREELNCLKTAISDDEFEKELSMCHPDLISYPLPRLLYIQKLYGTECEVLMPKELIIRDLTGKTLTDIFSMRGIANLEFCKYSENLAQKLGISLKLPSLGYPTDIAGYVTEDAAKKYSLPPQIPIYLGCNDFFAGLLGMGVYNRGDAFDLSGTSEHIGYIEENINRDSFVSGKYFVDNCTYGGTKSSGLSCDFAIKNFGIDGIDIDNVINDAPIFLPYLNGERAPVFDENARGVYFGLGKTTDKEALAYSTLEGVVFSLYDIASSMKMPPPTRLVCSGGSAKNMLMNKLRASIFGCDVVSVSENSASALGACMLAMVGDGVYKDIKSAISDCVKYTDAVKPIPKYQSMLSKRFAIYKELYQNLKPTFKKFKDIKEITK